MKEAQTQQKRKRRERGGKMERWKDDTNYFTSSRVNADFVFINIT